MINFSNSTPAPPAGGSNVLWQADSSGDVSAYIAKRKVTVAPVSGVLTLDASVADSFFLNINAAVTSMAINNPADGQEILLLFAQDSSGHAVTLATNLKGATAPSTTANTHSAQHFSYNSADTNWYACGTGVTGM